jgi:hypothetical protein
LLFVEDDTLGTVATPNGAVTYLRVVPVTSDELEAVEQWSVRSFIELLRRRSPALIADPRRRSILRDAGVAAEVAEGIQREGSATAVAFVDLVAWVRTYDEAGGDGQIRLSLGATAAAALRLALGRVRGGRPWIAIGEADAPNTAVVFVRAEAPGWMIDQRVDPDRPALVVQLTDPLIGALEAALAAPPGAHAWPELPGLTLRVVPALPERGPW